MALGTPTLGVSPNPGATGGTCTSVSFTTPAGYLLVCMAVARGGSAAMPTVSDSLSETWTPITAGNVAGSGSIRSRLFTKVATGAAQTITITSALASQTAATLMQVASAEVVPSNIKMDTGASGARSLTMNAFGAGSGCLYFLCGGAGTTWGTPVGYTELTDGSPTTNVRVVCGHDVTSPGTAIATTPAGGTIDSTLYGIEIREPVSGPVGAKTKIWSGSAWVEKPLARWDGSAWVQEAPKVWSGTAWVSSAMPPWTPPGSGMTASLVTSFTPGGERADFTGDVGIRIQPAVDKTYTWIGLNASVANYGLHKVRLYDWNTLELLRAADVDLSATPLNEWGWAAIAPITLVAGSYYAVVKEVVQYEQWWWDMGTTELKPEFITEVYSCYRGGSAGAFTANGDNRQYVGLDLGW